MKKILSAALAGLMLIGAAPAAFADGALTLTESSHLVLDAENGYVDNIDGTVTVGKLKAEFASAVSILGADGKEKADTDPVATDDTVTAGADSLKALIYGDVDRNGKINLGDVTSTLKYLAGWGSEMSLAAANVADTADGEVNIADAVKLLKYAAGWDDISLGDVRMVFRNEKLIAENERSDMELYFETPLMKISRDNTQSTGEYAYKMKLAKNETESCQFFITPSFSAEGLTVELSDFVHEYGEGTLTGNIYQYYYYNMTVYTNSLKGNGGETSETGYFPEALLPLADSFEVTEGKSHGFHINVTTAPDSPAGMYKAVLSVKDADGNVIKCANVYAYVWNFALPDTPYSASSFGLSWYDIHATLGLWSGDDSKTYSKYYELLLDHNVSAYQLPFDVTDPRADAYMSDPRVTSFEIGGENLRFPDEDNAEELVAAFNKVQSNEVWKEKGHLYYVDEPYEPGYALVQGQYEYLVDLLGTDDFKIIMPFFNSMVDRAKNIDMLEFIKPYVDIFVPRSDGFMKNFDDDRYGHSFWTPRQAFIKYGESLPRLQSLKYELGKELWWYVCIEPPFPYPNLFTMQQGVMNRVIWWQQFMFDVDGFLYWATTADWGKVHKNMKDYPGIGDGNLLLYGQLFGYTEPIATFRLVQIRDGFDDFDYLRMAEEIVGTEEVMKIVNTLTTGVTYVKENPDYLEAARDAVAEIIENAQ